MQTRKHKDTKSQEKKPLPRPGWHKRDPKELEKILNDAIESSMPTSDAIAVVIPDVKRDPDTPAEAEKEKT